MDMNNQLLWGCIADDFTGASDAASFFVKGGLKTLLFSGLPSDAPASGCQAVVIALKTRTQETASAVRDTLQAARWLKSHGAKQLYIKYCSTFDSTPKGNIGPILDALLEEYDLPYTLLCPALPVNGRQVLHGRLYVNGVPLDQSPMGQHPLTPMWDSRIRVLMEAQSKYPCMHVDSSHYLLPASQIDDSVKHFSTEHPHFYVIPDYQRDEDAAVIADLFGDLPLLSGGSGLLVELARRLADNQNGQLSADQDGRLTRDPDIRLTGNLDGLLSADQDGQPTLDGPWSQKEDDKPACQPGVNLDGSGRPDVKTGTAGPGLLLAGSCSQMTRRQIAYAQSHGIPSLQIIPQKLLDGSQTPEDLWHFIRSHKDQTVLVYSSDSPEHVKAVQQSGKERIAQLLEQTAAQLACKAVEEGYTRILVAGGETSGAVTKALKFNSYMIGESVAPGVPVMIPQNRPELRLVLKSGNFGQEDFFLKALEITANRRIPLY